VHTLNKQQANRIPIGSSYVTRREFSILTLYCNGSGQKEAAAKLAAAPKTIDSILLKVKQRLKAKTLHEAIATFAAYRPEFKRAG
jgi:DNA-binding NarL/FixJ family response regulator